MLFYPTEMDVKFVEMLQQRSERCALRHFGKGVHILGETLAAIAIFAIGTWHVGVRVVNVTRKQHTRVHLAPVGPHLLAILATGIEVGDLIGAKHIMHVLR